MVTQMNDTELEILWDPVEAGAVRARAIEDGRRIALKEVARMKAEYVQEGIIRGLAGACLTFCLGALFVLYLGLASLP